MNTIYQRYLQKQKRNPQLSLLPFCPITIVIPCYDEPKIIATLKSLWAACEDYKEELHCIIVLNHSKNSPKEAILQNEQTKKELATFKNKYANSLRFISIIEKSFEENSGGVGKARKLGMDEAIFQYASHDKKGIIVSLDADTLVSKNYLSEIYRHLKKNPKDNTLILNYAHPLDKLLPSQKEAIIQYELYLRYMTLAYRYVGHPNAFHTIGSAFAVDTIAYCKQNGMNGREAGEDFYFLQKMFSLGECSELNTVCVQPSSRTSNRVPFGTGKSVNDLMTTEEDLQTYSFKAFEELKVFFDGHLSLYKISKEPYEKIVYNDLGGLIKSWLIETDFFKELEKINANCSSEKSFSKKFFESFSILEIIKYLNFSHTHFLQKVGIFHAISCLKQADIFDFQSSEKLLYSLRSYLKKLTFRKD